jgi:sRNA-binding protein
LALPDIATNRLVAQHDDARREAPPSRVSGLDVGAPQTNIDAASMLFVDSLEAHLDDFLGRLSRPGSLGGTCQHGALWAPPHILPARKGGFFAKNSMSQTKSRARSRREIAAKAALSAAFPLAFPDDDSQIRPLAIGTRDDVLAWMDRVKPDVERRAAIAAVQHHGARTADKRCLLEPGAMRIDLHGRPIAPVSPEAVECARTDLERVRENQAQAAMRRAGNLARMDAETEARQAQKSPAKAKKPAPKPVAAPVPKPVIAPAPNSIAAVVVKKTRRIVPGSKSENPTI